MTARQTRFVQEYLANGQNATAAAIAAGYSRATAASIGSENLRKPEIAHAIAAAQQRVSSKLELDADTIARELAAVGFALVPTNDVTPGSKVQALTSLAKMLGHWKEKQAPEAGEGTFADWLSDVGESLQRDERRRIEAMTTAEIDGECRVQHHGLCRSINEHVDRCADAAWRSRDRRAPVPGGDQWRVNARADGKSGLFHPEPPGAPAENWGPANPWPDDQAEGTPTPLKEPTPPVVAAHVEGNVYVV